MMVSLWPTDRPDPSTCRASSPQRRRCQHSDRRFRPSQKAHPLPLSLFNLLAIALVTPAMGQCPAVPALSPAVESGCTLTYDTLSCLLVLWCRRCNSPVRISYNIIDVAMCSEGGRDTSGEEGPNGLRV
ncbi:hypothetical protein HYH03_005921 [Edaphochlamys debaryana]|uniref:Uncharacterized protein n=1 Tax=Edaphochlamys debaryana TaxID=47281 RepID=A0A835Y766_9CHLO|nr:hypothetical protein HYH03_005921 [Edaphochlamys debaryana]|eukprot:KAG2495998.1 hypothetical protein HYH03_005921 [Edaphochlamys debaryana]